MKGFLIFAVVSVMWLIVSFHETSAFGFVEVGLPEEWIWDNLFIPILIVSLSATALLFWINRKEWNAGLKSMLYGIFGFAGFTACAFALCFMFLKGSALLVNRLAGKQEKVLVRGIVEDYDIHKPGGRSFSSRSRHYISVVDSTLPRPVRLKVPSSYIIGSRFKKEMMRGSLGLYYMNE